MPLVSLYFLLTLAAPLELHVAPGGQDSAAGGPTTPLATLAAAQVRVRQLRAAAAAPAPVRVILAGGTYRLSSPLVFGPSDSGSAEAPITWEAKTGEQPVISGGRLLTGWRAEPDGAWSAPAGEAFFHQLFVNGRRAQRARTPNSGYLRAAGLLEPIPSPPGSPGYNRPELRTRLRYQPGDAAKWPDLDSLQVRLYHAWTGSLHWVADIDEQARILHFTAPSGWPVGYWEPNQRYVLENVRAAFDQPGEWYLDRAAQRVYYRPLPGEVVPDLEIVAPITGQLLRLLGAAQAGLWVEHLTFRGVSFQHAEWVMPPDRAHDGQACVDAGRSALAGAIETIDARDCLFEGCEVTRVGPYAVALGSGSRTITLRQCELHDLGSGGVVIGTPGGEADAPQAGDGNTVENCFIHDGGWLAPAGIGVLILRSSHNVVRRNEVCDFFYSGMSVGWDWGFSPTSAHDNLLEYNHIHHLGGGVLSDLGGIYTLGISPGTVLRGNVIHDVFAYSYGGWGLYNDASSSRITMERNVVYRNKHEAYHLGNGVGNLLRHNLFVGSGEAMIYRSLNLGQLPVEPTFTIEHNVICGDRGWMLHGRWGDGQYLMRSNAYHSAGDPPLFDSLDFATWQRDGHDADSRLADPQLAWDAEGRPQARNTALLRELGIELLDDYGQVGLYGPAEWVARPRQVKHRELDPEMQPVKPYRPPRTAIVEDFESTAVGAAPAGDGGDLTLLKVTDTTAGQGRRSLHFLDTPDLAQPWQPHFYYEPAWRRSGLASGSFRLRLGQGALLTHEWRDWSQNPHLPGPTIRFGDGQVQVGGKMVAQVPVDRWFEVGLTCGLGEQATGTFALTIRIDGEPDQIVKALPAGVAAWRHATWLGWISYAPGQAEAWLDDLRFELKP